MYKFYKMYPYPYCFNTPMYNLYNLYNLYNMPKYYNMYPCPYCCCVKKPMYNAYFSKQPTNFTNKKQYNSEFHFLRSSSEHVSIELKDYGPEPFVINIDEATKQNSNFRTALWTGEDLQVTLMNINAGEDIGLEIHPDVDQFIRIEEGQGLVKIGDSKDKLDFQEKVYDDYAIMIPAGKWHNIINTGDNPLKLYSIYAPPEHPRGTVHKTKADAEAAEKNYDY